MVGFDLIFVDKINIQVETLLDGHRIAHVHLDYQVEIGKISLHYLLRYLNQYFKHFCVSL